jgi:hypothetical protein
LEKNYQEVKEKREQVDPCIYEVSKGERAVERCQARIKGGGDAEGGGLFDNMLDNLREEMTVSQGGTAVNKWLWNGSIETLESFPLKIADAFGGVIETDWLIKEGIPNERCAVKVLIKSKDLISNGVKVNMICQKYDGSSWVISNQDVSNANREIENSILTLARKSYITFSG